jgi:Excalibur calcium-binding domain
MTMNKKSLAILGLFAVMSLGNIALPVEANQKKQSTPQQQVNNANTKKIVAKKFVTGTCKELKAKGIYNIPKGDVNYNKQRDRDNDGIACETNGR